MDMNLFYKRIFDFRDILGTRIAEAALRADTGVEAEKLQSIVNQVNAEISNSYSDMVTSLQNLEETQKKKKSTRGRKK